MVFKYVEQLANYLSKNVILHEKSRYVILPKPYGVSCVGQRQEGGGIFENSVRDEEKREFLDGTVIKRNEHDVVIEDCIPLLKRYLDEPMLTFCTGLKRYLSGSIVLPCSPHDFQYLKKSINRANASAGRNEPYHHTAIVIALNRPPQKEGYIQGYATFQQVGTHKEYIFVEENATKRMRSGKYAIMGRVEYEVLGEANGCSLLKVSTNKFARHFPRIALSNLGCPVLGDEIYCSRLYDLEGEPTILPPQRKFKMKDHKSYFPEQICQNFDMKEDALRNALPMYFHVFQTVFPKYGQKDKVTDEEAMYLTAGSQPPAHFMAALNVLQLRGAYEDFLKKNEDQFFDRESVM
ncbi:hypothetical protein WR25_14834 isoform A [Diploscapter pachys]|uniref:Uncharacterized protein n=2 Tax=Diploscapter pachys TaxID=2018661 RepID=A0A2A2KMW8_9BILA|nr:hypothetical protein WR25_14834 isoform A [Diploscapter pachys]